MAHVSMDELTPYRTQVYDNQRWRHFQSRPDDVFVCTPAKCGTTWMQTIVANLLFPDGKLPIPVVLMSPWIEFVLMPEDEMLAGLEAQTHRRVVKSHSPADGIPWFDDARYVFVGRDGLDSFMSFCNHVERMKLLNVVNEMAVADGLDPLVGFSGDYHEFFGRWIDLPDTPPRMLAGYWERRHQPNVLLVHYNDLKRDREAEMRRVAGFLGIEVDEALWPGCVERCSFEYMREHPEMVGDFDPMFEGGTKGFIFKGTNGRWRDVLTESEVSAYRQQVEQCLPSEAIAWLEDGRGA